MPRWCVCWGTVVSKAPVSMVRHACHIRGKMRKKVWVNQGDIVLLGIREFQDDKADVILKYSSEEARKLKAVGELPDTATINAADATGENLEEEMPFSFEEI